MGWFTNQPRLTDWFGTGICVFPNTALTALFLSAAIFLALSPSRLAGTSVRVLGLLGILIGSLNLYQHITGVNLGIDTLVLTPQWGARGAAAPGRMGPPASASFLLLGAALFCVTGARSRRLVPSLSIGVLAIVSLGLIGYIFGADPLFAAAKYTGISLPTGTILLTLALALLALVPELEPVRILKQSGASGVLARRSIIFAVLVPLTLGQIFVAGREARWFDRGMGVALLVLVMIALSCLLLWWCIGDIARHEEASQKDLSERKRAEQELATAHQALAQQVTGLTRLHNLSTRLMASSDINPGLVSILETLAELHNTQLGLLSLASEDGKFLHVGASLNFSSEALEQLKEVRAGTGACGAAFAEKRRVIVEDTETDPLFEPFRALARVAGFRAVHSTPILSRDGRALGVLSVHLPQPGRPTQMQMQFADICARQAADFMELQRAASELSNTNRELEARVEERTASLKQALAQMEEFSYSVSHDLRAPARAMQGFAQTLLEDYGKSLDEGGRKHLDIIISSAQRMDRLIQDILAYSRVGRNEAAFRTVELDSFVRELIKHSPELANRNAQIQIEGKLPDVLGHSSSIGQVVSNLLNNAAKFVRAGIQPAVTIRAERFNGTARIWFEDNGIGIKPTHQNKLFGLFARVHTDGDYEGTGIGLAIVRKAVDKMGGRVGVESDGVSGSKFWIELPAAEHPPALST